MCWLPIYSWRTASFWGSKSIRPNRHEKRVATNLTTLPIGDTPIPINGTRPLFLAAKIGIFSLSSKLFHSFLFVSKLFRFFGIIFLNRMHKETYSTIIFFDVFFHIDIYMCDNLQNYENSPQLPKQLRGNVA